jgi:hypothetical protein
LAQTRPPRKQTYLLALSSTSNGQQLPVRRSESCKGSSAQSSEHSARSLAQIIMRCIATLSGTLMPLCTRPPTLPLAHQRHVLLRDRLRGVRHGRDARVACEGCERCAARAQLLPHGQARRNGRHVGRPVRAWAAASTTSGAPPAAAADGSTMSSQPAGKAAKHRPPPPCLARTAPATAGCHINAVKRHNLDWRHVRGVCRSLASSPANCACDLKLP